MLVKIILSFLHGVVIVALPSLWMARQIAKPIKQEQVPLSALLSFLWLELVKIILALGLLVLALWAPWGTHWLALIAGLICSSLLYLVRFFFKIRQG